MGTLNAMRALRTDPIRRLPIRDLVAELETARWLALEFAPGDASRQFAELRVADLADELERRKRLARRHGGDPLTPRWPDTDGDLRARVEQVKAAWPIDRFCRELLGMALEPAGNGRFRGCCPYPDHDDTTPSFVLYPDGDAWCFGCQRGGDVLRLTGMVFGLERFYDQLERLERECGIEPGRQTA